jgi:hypothetical protein
VWHVNNYAITSVRSPMKNPTPAYDNSEIRHR